MLTTQEEKSNVSTQVTRQTLQLPTGEIKAFYVLIYESFFLISPPSANVHPRVPDDPEPLLSPLHSS